MISLDKEAPELNIDGIVSGNKRKYTLKMYEKKWIILFFYPADFTFVCPTEVIGFNNKMNDFQKANAEVIGISVDDLKSHEKWSNELGGLKVPLLSDTDFKVSRDYGVLDEKDQKAFRATFIINPQKKIAYINISPMNVGRSVDETYRILTALQTGRLCPAEWKSGEQTLDPSLKY